MNTSDNKESFNNISAKIKEIENEENRTTKLKLIILGVFGCMILGSIYLFAFNETKVPPVSESNSSPTAPVVNYSGKQEGTQNFERGNNQDITDENLPKEGVIIRQILPEESTSSLEDREENLFLEKDTEVNPNEANINHSDEFKEVLVSESSQVRATRPDESKSKSKSNKKPVATNSVNKSTNNKPDSFPTFKDWLKNKKDNKGGS